MHARQQPHSRKRSHAPAQQRKPPHDPGDGDEVTIDSNDGITLGIMLLHSAFGHTQAVQRKCGLVAACRHAVVNSRCSRPRTAAEEAGREAAPQPGLLLAAAAAAAAVEAAVDGGGGVEDGLLAAASCWGDSSRDARPSLRAAARLVRLAACPHHAL